MKTRLYAIIVTFLFVLSTIEAIGWKHKAELQSKRTITITDRFCNPIAVIYPDGSISITNGGFTSSIDWP